jgi:hypothetical protein
MSRNLIVILALICVSLTTYGQNRKFTVSGQLTDAGNGEDLPFANVIINDLPGVGTTSNVYGFYSISLTEGEYTISYQYIGYATVEKKIVLNKDLKINVELAEDTHSLDEVVISAEKDDHNITGREVSVTKIDIKEIKELPTFGGEHDIIKVMQTNPGIKPAGEGNSGFYVRGGGLDQNLILLDEAPVYNPSHLLGFFSVFNGDALKSATMYKGAMMPEYGGRTSSVMDIRMKDGNSKKYSLSGGIGTIASRLTAEGPIVKDKGSFMISGRRTYGDLFLMMSNDESMKNTKLYFYDLNLKTNYKVSEKDRIYLSGYFGRDKFGFDDTFGLNWGNSTGTFRWNHLFSDRLFSNTSLIYSNYDYQFSFGEDEDHIALQSVIKDMNLKQDFTYFPNSNNSLKFGFNAIHHNIQPGNLSAGSNTGVNSKDAEPKYGIEGAVYIQNEQKLGSRFGVNYGLRYSLFNQIGPGTAYTFDEDGNYMSETLYGNSESIQTYGGFEPRVSASLILNEKNSVKAGFNRNYQYMHLLTNATSSTPTDTWIMSSNNVKPQIADQVSVGYFRNFAKNTFETSVEAYYKEMQNVIDYRNGADVFLNELLEGDLVFGDGLSYGLEFFVKKKSGRLTGWASYTLSRTLRQFDEINEGGWFPARQDRIHDVSLVAMYKLSPKLVLSGNFIYYTGDAVTFPAGRYIVDGKVIPYYTERNGYRMPDHHRMDLSLTWYRKKTEKFESSWNFSLYNVYGRENAYTISFRPNEDDPTKTEAVQLSLFKWLPSFTYNFRF